MQTEIFIKGARENNLKNIDVTIPRDKLVVLTGLSGSGKSSLAFDTIYAEGQRRYVESLSSYARMFLGQMDKPDVDYIEGLSPAISIDQKTTSKNPRSTVGTVTEIYDYLRLLWARVGTPHCPHCGKEIRRQTVDQIIDQILALPEGTRIQVMAPVVRGRKGEHAKVLEDTRRSGFVRARVDGNMYELSEDISLEKNLKHRIDIVVDRLIVRPDIAGRLTDSVETASNLANGLVTVNLLREERDITFSQNYACDDCGISIEELTPRLFSFNSPFGACPTCTGLGLQLKADPALIIPDGSKSILEGAITATGWASIRSDGISRMYFEALSKKYRFSLTQPYDSLSDEVKNVILYGTGGEKLELHYDQPRGKGVLYQAFEGICNNLERRYQETQSDASKKEIEGLMTPCPCPACQGQRLRPEALAVTVGGKSIYDATTLPVDDALAFFDHLDLTGNQQIIAAQILKEIHARLGFLQSVGLSYLTLSRASGTLSGGESQRIRLATQIGSALTGVLYVLDEPSIGLHQRDNERLLKSLADLRDLGNTVIVVEHDEDAMRSADYLVDMGPGAGEKGGEVLAAGTPEEVMASERSLTGKYLRGELKIPVPKERLKPERGWLTLSGACGHNLRNVTLRVPVGLLSVVTGVSGSGKSSLVIDTLYAAMSRTINRATTMRPLPYGRIENIEAFDKVIMVDQSPIGRTPRSNPATYTGIFSAIREVFEQTQTARERGYAASRFSFNVKGGRCEACQGDGIVCMQMQFLPDVYVPCDVCHGRRYNRETLEVTYQGRNIADVLEMTVDEALPFFDAYPKIKRVLQALADVGLGYIKLGQSATTFSGGEAQRIMLAAELSRPETGRTLYILDEPTTGLHFKDIEQLLGVLRRLTDQGNTVLLIEHNLDVVKCADYVVDMGPDGGENGGVIMAEGTPEEVAESDSVSSPYLKRVL